MRIITGNFKGKKILQPKDKATRPLKDLTKESIFNIILHSKKFKVLLENSNILDLFSGSGSFGLECLSRGSKKVIFVENYKEILPILKKNKHLTPMCYINGYRNCPNGRCLLIVTSLLPLENTPTQQSQTNYTPHSNTSIV